MLAYKFRSASQLQYAFDIIINNRLYCSDWRQLNDPMEGMFGYSTRATDEQDHSDQVADIIRHKKNLLICSLSRTFDCHLLWAHYASGFEGMAIEVELPDNAPNVRVVQYRGVFAHVAFDDLFNAERVAEEILSSKYKEWEYEREVRILQAGKWYGLPTPVRRVIAGHRMHPAVLSALQIICERKNITLRRTGIGDEGIDADSVLPFNDRGRKSGKHSSGRAKPRTRRRATS
jgi:hypothetical protein